MTVAEMMPAAATHAPLAWCGRRSNDAGSRVSLRRHPDPRCATGPRNAGGDAMPRLARPGESSGFVWALGLSLVLCLSTGGVRAADPVLGLARCAGIAADAARLACFDALATRSGAAPGAAQVQPPADRPAETDSALAVAGTAQRSAAPRAASAPSAAAADAPGAAPTETAEQAQRRALGILPYRKNYVLPVTYNANVNNNLPEEPSFELPLFGEDALDDLEMKFQISFEVPLWTDILKQPLDLYFGYTQLAFFQAYNAEYSSPFRETNYEPEMGLHWLPGWRIGTAGSNWRLASVRVAANHQSNGRAEPLSRSWNRLTAEATVERGDLTLGLRLWSLLGANPPDNPNIDDYLGYGEVRAGYDLGRHRLGLMLRSVEHPTVQLDWSYPLSDRVRVYAQYFNGYGESLLDYDHSVNRIGAGFLLEDGR